MAELGFLILHSRWSEWNDVTAAVKKKNASKQASTPANYNNRGGYRTPLERLSKLDCFVTRRAPTANDTFSGIDCVDKIFLFNAGVLGTNNLLVVE